MRGSSDTNSGPVCGSSIPTLSGPKRMERRVRTTQALDRFVGAGQSTSIARTFTGIGGGFAKRYER
jgi:hypothetical protein